MHGMVEVTLVRSGEELLTDASSDVVVHGRVSLTASTFPIRRNMHGCSHPTRWTYMLHEYGACSGTFLLPAVGCTAVVEASIEWGSVDVFRAPSERCESLMTTLPGRQVARVTLQQRTLLRRPFSDVERCCLVSCSNRSQSRQDHHRRCHRRASQMRAVQPVPRCVWIEGDDNDGDGPVYEMKAATTTKVNNAHCVLTCVYCLHVCVCVCV